MSPGNAQPADSAPIERWKLGNTARDTVAYFPLPPRSRRVLMPGDGSRAFETDPQWTVGGKGQIAIVRPDPYSVEMIGTDGKRIRGRPIPFKRVRVTEAHKKLWIGAESRPKPVMIQRPGKSAPTAGLRPFKPLEPIHWPTHLPPFLESALHFAPDGRLWIQRTTDVGVNQVFDIVEGKGVLVDQVETPENSRLAGFGRSCMYLIRLDADQQEILERYVVALPEG